MAINISNGSGKPTTVSSDSHIYTAMTITSPQGFDIHIPSEIMDGKYDVDQLFNLGLQKKEEIEKLVQELWDKKEKEAQEEALSKMTIAYRGAAKSAGLAGQVGDTKMQEWDRVVRDQAKLDKGLYD